MTGRLEQRALEFSACDATGLSDWGPDTTFRTGLGKLIDAIEAQPYAEAIRADATDEIVQLLATRLRLQDDARREPVILEGRIERPLILTGAPRSGTTWLYELLSLDPVARAPLDWEVSAPWPAPEAATFDTDPRIASKQAAFDAMLAAEPSLATMHHWDARAPQECNCFTTYHFASSNFWSSYGVPEYLDWLTYERPDGVFNTHKRVLQQLQWKGPRGRWLLKSPPHLLSLDELIAAYPDAMIIQTHREPASMVASLASFIRALRRVRYPAVAELIDPRAIAQDVVKHFGEGLDRSVETRRLPEVDERIVDVAYKETVADPIGAVRRIYAHFGLDFTPQHRARLEALIATERSTGHGKHDYDPEEFGVRGLGLADRFSAYRKRFGDLL